MSACTVHCTALQAYSPALFCGNCLYSTVQGCLEACKQLLCSVHWWFTTIVQCTLVVYNYCAVCTGCLQLLYIVLSTLIVYNYNTVYLLYNYCTVYTGCLQLLLSTLIVYNYNTVYLQLLYTVQCTLVVYNYCTLYSLH